jgi:hypothetical protein
MYIIYYLSVLAIYPSIPIEEEEYKFIELKTQPDDDCSIYSKLYLKS